MLAKSAWEVDRFGISGPDWGGNQVHCQLGTKSAFEAEPDEPGPFFETESGTELDFFAAVLPL